MISRRTGNCVGCFPRRPLAGYSSRLFKTARVSRVRKTALLVLRLVEIGLSDTYADVIDDTLSIVCGEERQWWTHHRWRTEL